MAEITCITTKEKVYKSTSDEKAYARVRKVDGVLDDVMVARGSYSIHRLAPAKVIALRDLLTEVIEQERWADEPNNS